MSGMIDYESHILKRLSHLQARMARVSKLWVCLQIINSCFTQCTKSVWNQGCTWNLGLEFERLYFCFLVRNTALYWTQSSDTQLSKWLYPLTMRLRNFTDGWNVIDCPLLGYQSAVHDWWTVSSAYDMLTLLFFKILNIRVFNHI